MYLHDKKGFKNEESYVLKWASYNYISFDNQIDGRWRCCWWGSELRPCLWTCRCFSAPRRGWWQMESLFRVVLYTSEIPLLPPDKWEFSDQLMQIPFLIIVHRYVFISIIFIPKQKYEISKFFLHFNVVILIIIISQLLRVPFLFLQ